jgi:hypothetical protein
MIPVNKAVLNGTIFENTPFDIWFITQQALNGIYGDGFFFYTPFNITVIKMAENYKDKTLAKAFSHDMCHALDCFMQGKVDRLFSSEMGYGKPVEVNWTMGMWEHEVRILSMQYALLKPSFPCIKFFTKAATELYSRVPDDLKIGPWYNQSFDATKYMEEFIANSLKKAKLQFEDLKNAYHTMCEFIHRNEDKRVKI